MWSRSYCLSQGQFVRKSVLLIKASECVHVHHFVPLVCLRFMAFCQQLQHLLRYIRKCPMFWTRSPYFMPHAFHFLYSLPCSTYSYIQMQTGYSLLWTPSLYSTGKRTKWWYGHSCQYRIHTGRRRSFISLQKFIRLFRLVSFFGSLLMMWYRSTRPNGFILCSPK